MRNPVRRCSRLSSSSTEPPPSTIAQISILWICFSLPTQFQANKQSTRIQDRDSTDREIGENGEFNQHVHLPSSQQVEKERSLLHHHKESHFTAGEIVHDIIIRVSDGLTVPFALAAGLSGANASSSIILSAGIVEVAAGAISMGLGGYLLQFSNLDLVPVPVPLLLSRFHIFNIWVLFVIDCPKNRFLNFFFQILNDFLLFILYQS